MSPEGSAARGVTGQCQPEAKGLGAFAEGPQRLGSTRPVSRWVTGQAEEPRRSHRDRGLASPPRLKWRRAGASPPRAPRTQRPWTRRVPGTAARPTPGPWTALRPAHMTTDATANVGLTGTGNGDTPRLSEAAASRTPTTRPIARRLGGTEDPRRRVSSRRRPALPPRPCQAPGVVPGVRRTTPLTSQARRTSRDDHTRTSHRRPRRPVRGRLVAPARRGAPRRAAGVRLPVGERPPALPRPARRRADVRRPDHARGTRPAHIADRPRNGGALGHVPPPGGCGQGGLAPRRDLRRAHDPRAGDGLAPRGARRLRDPVPAPRRAHRGSSACTRRRGGDVRGAGGRHARRRATRTRPTLPHPSNAPAPRSGSPRTDRCCSAWPADAQTGSSRPSAGPTSSRGGARSPRRHGPRPAVPRSSTRSTPSRCRRGATARPTTGWPTTPRRSARIRRGCADGWAPPASSLRPTSCARASPSTRRRVQPV